MYHFVRREDDVRRRKRRQKKTKKMKHRRVVLQRNTYLYLDFVMDFNRNGSKER